MATINLLKLPSDFICHQCGMRMEMGSPITKAAENGYQKGHLIACGECGTFHRVGDSALERLTVAEFKALPQDIQKLLAITRFQIEQKNAKGN